MLTTPHGLFSPRRLAALLALAVFATSWVGALYGDVPIGEGDCDPSVPGDCERGGASAFPMGNGGMPGGGMDPSQYDGLPGGGMPRNQFPGDDGIADGQGESPDMKLFRGRQEKDMEMYGNLLVRFEATANHWCCAAVGRPLYKVPGDKDVMNYIHYMFSHTLLKEGQHYGSQLVMQYHMARKPEDIEYTCDGISLGDSNHVGDAALAVIQLKDDLVAWLNHNEVNADDITGPYIPVMRETMATWTLSRLGAVAQLPSDEELERVVDSLLPLVEGVGTPSEQCSNAGLLASLTRNLNALGRVRRTVLGLLDGCYRHGKLADDPVEFGEVLRGAGRETEARELFQLAVQRGSLCNVWQRPESHHRKDLAAKPVWSPDDFPAFRDALKQTGAVAKVAEAVQRGLFPFSGDQLTMANQMKSGWLERTGVFSRGTLNATVCDAIGNATCTLLERSLRALEESNDGYAVMCNGSIAVELWRMPAGSESRSTVGQTNIVMQYLQQLPSATLAPDVIWQLGEDTLHMDNTATAGSAAVNEGYVIDDTYENHVRVVSSDAGAAEDASAVAVLFHVQLCHPDLHEKAVETPSKKCAA